MSLLTLVRHGQASYLSEDYDRLSELGEAQARKLGEFWVRHELTFDRVFHGPAKRHIRTMEIASVVVQEAGLSWPESRCLTDFDEFDAFQVMKKMVPIMIEEDERVRLLHDDFRANQNSPEAGRLLQKLFEEVARHWCSGRFSVPEVESWEQFRSRVARAITLVQSEAPKSSSTVVFTSAGPIAATMAQVLCLEPRRAIEFVWLARNCSYAEFLFSADRFSLSSFNSIPHLNDRELLTYR
jgi:broad specificity phosphatase PhoE